MMTITTDFIERKKGKHLTLSDRNTIARMLRKGFDKKSIANAIGCCLATIYNEIKRGSYIHTLSDPPFEVIRYAPELAQQRYDKNLRNKKHGIKLMQDQKQRAFIETLIIDNDWSPMAALLYIQKNNIEFDMPIRSVNTIYNGIRKGYFNNLELAYLPQRGKYKDKKKSSVKTTKRGAPGLSIELRSDIINQRNHFGHWEMDTVMGKKKNKKCLLVLTERKTRYEIIEVMKEGTIDEVRKALDRIEKKYGCDFYKIFKTITVDNGKEFSGVNSMERALYRVGKRTQIFYCHPYSSFERGSNEVSNKLVRRFFPKGADFDTMLTRTAAKRCQEWMNDYPRALFGGKSSRIIFENELINL